MLKRIRLYVGISAAAIIVLFFVNILIQYMPQTESYYVNEQEINLVRNTCGAIMITYSSDRIHDNSLVVTEQDLSELSRLKDLFTIMEHRIENNIYNKERYPDYNNNKFFEYNGLSYHEFIQYEQWFKEKSEMEPKKANGVFQYNEREYRVSFAIC